MNNISIGHDSEFGLSNKNLVVSALDYLQDYEGESGRFFPDNMNAEIAINPVNSLEDFHSYTEDLLDKVKQQGFGLIMKPTIKYPDESMENPLAYISGCNPDYSAYTEHENKAPDFTTSDSTRSCGAHVHLGYEGLDPYNWARWMDVFAALPLLEHEEKSDRRKMYGGAGCLRVKPYGAEYRTLSNIWIGTKAGREFVWNAAHKALEMSLKGDSRELIKDWWEIPTAIDSHDLDKASSLLDYVTKEFGVYRYAG